MIVNAERHHPLRHQADAGSSEPSGGVEHRGTRSPEAFSREVRETLVRADRIAGRLGYIAINTEHLLVGVVHTAPELFQEMNYDAGKIITAVEAIAGIARSVSRLTPASSGPEGLSPRAGRVLDLAVEEHRYRTGNATPNAEVDQYDLLTGILREGVGLGARILISAGASEDQVRSAIERIRERKRTSA